MTILARERQKLGRLLYEISGDPEISWEDARQSNRAYFLFKAERILEAGYVLKEDINTFRTKLRQLQHELHTMMDNLKE